MKKAIWVLFLIAWSSAFLPALMAQQPGQVQGTVEDPHRAPVAQASVKLIPQPTGTALKTVTDEAGKAVSRTTDITVTCPPQFVRMPDIIFGKNNARVNNCGKRLLIDDASNRLSSGEYDVVLVGHRDSDEAENGTATRARGTSVAEGQLCGSARRMTGRAHSVRGSSR